MPRASVKRLIKCEKNQLIDLVLDIEKYPTFVPYCIDAKVYEKNDSIYVKNIGGPLKYLDNKWIFEDHKDGTEIYFDVDFQIKNKLLNILMTTSFEYGLDKIADAFQKRANQLYKI